MKLCKKVYIVHTGIFVDGEDTGNWSAHKTIAQNAKEAIKNIEPKLVKGEYVEYIELVIRLD